ncbi:DUF1524 domain-containing protein [Otariodibacter oris]|uniref:DUF1524 domain-containing protein n=1 Tax=Otariodibacter oris TaxID=1032623 RepID=UPI0012B4CF6E|nr:DUF1524 domain-containing protein [Otariodibacter oris]QGM80840.1 hypothetical protein A6A10_05200 [Otariodibacter oris]
MNYLDPSDGVYKLLPDGVKVSIDHILPQSAFKRIPGFNKLPREVKKALINDPSNLQPTPLHINISKGAKVGDKILEWEKVKSTGELISLKYRQKIKTRQDQIIDMVTEEVKKRGL